MKKQYHILNGDALKEQFPKELEGEVIVMRECLVDGDVNGETLTKLFETRAWFISQNYSVYTRKDYFEETVPEINKIDDIQGSGEINLWFEDDLFCQVNFWFVCSLLKDKQQNNKVYLVRPEKHTQYGFGGLNSDDLVDIYKKRALITEINEIAKLWSFYQNNDMKGLLDAGERLKDIYPFIFEAVIAHIDRIPTKNYLGRPTVSLIEIVEELETNEFGPVFQEFCKRESIYGFGDLQVKRLFDKVKRSISND